MNLGAAIEEAGVVGAGGAGFPTHVKVRAKVDVVIANFAECEPLVSSDSAVVSHDPERFLAGLELVRRAVGAERAAVALKRKERKGALPLEELRAKGEGGPSIHYLEDVYPAGDEHLLVEEVTGRAVPQAGIPPDVSVLVNNVTTLWRVALANEGKPFTERFVTVAGEVRSPATLLAPVGTPVRVLLEACGGAKKEGVSVIVGGPMMGEVLGDLSQPVRKTTSAVLVLPEGSALVRRKKMPVSVGVRRAMAACMQCMDCTLLCPRYLLGHELSPHKAMRSVAFWIAQSEAEISSAVLCSECGLCGLFACTMELSPVQVYRRIREEFLRRGHAPAVRKMPRVPRPERSGRRVPTQRLMARLGIAEYDVALPVKSALLEVPEVRIPLREKWGRLRAIVRPGEKVGKGAVVAEPALRDRGARAHAGISGVVKSVERDWVCIEA
ncbi:MAG: 4Fe-4S dicluster domain-containing protein [Candidatus Eisenbacteria bacterium]